MAKFLHIAAVAAMLAVSLSCTKGSVELAYSSQESRIENFVNSQLKADGEAYVVNNGGATRLVLKDGKGESLKSGGTVSFHYAGYVMTGSSLSTGSMFATNVSDLASALNWTLSSEQAKVLTVNLSETDLLEGLAKGLEGVRGGEECIILFSGKYGYGNRQSGTIPANSALAYHVWVESISND